MRLRRIKEINQNTAVLRTEINSFSESPIRLVPRRIAFEQNPESDLVIMENLQGTASTSNAVVMVL